MLKVADASSLTKENIKGAVLAVPKIFYYDSDDSKAPQCWGYVVKVGEQVKRADRASFFLKGHDGSSPFYLAQHPRFKEAEMNRFIQHSDVKVLKLG